MNGWTFSLIALKRTRRCFVSAISLSRRVSALSRLPTHDPLGYWHPLEADLGGLWASRLSVNYRLLARPEDVADPRCAVTVTVIAIYDYH